MYWKDARWTLKRTVDPVVEPVTVDDLRQQCRIDSQEEDTLLRSFITAAREMVETDTRRALITQTWELKFDAFPCDVIEVRRCPLISVSSIAYVDTNGTSQTLASTVYSVDANSEPGRITLAYQQTWTTTRTQDNAVTMTFTAGYGAAATSVPERAKLAIRLLAAHWFNNRESTAFGAMNEIPLGYTSLIERLMWAGYR